MLGVGYRCQFEPNHLECVRLAREKVLGDVKVIDANFGFAIGDPTQWRLKRDSRRRRRADGRGHLLPADHAHAHRRRSDLDQRHRDQDRRRQVQGSRRNHPLADQVSERRDRQLRDHLFRQAACRAFVPRPRAAGSVSSRRISTAAIAAGAATAPEINIPVADQFAAELDDFADCIINKRPTRVPGEMGLRGREVPDGHLRVDQERPTRLHSRNHSP